MVAPYSSMRKTGIYVDPGNFNSWKAAATSISEYVPRQKDVSISVPVGYDSNYFFPGFGNAVHTNLISNPKDAGKAFSRAANARMSLEQVMNSGVPLDIGFYPGLRDYIAKYGVKDSWEVKEFGSIDRPQMVACVGTTKEGMRFTQTKNYSKAVANKSEAHKVSYEAAYLHNVLHEIVHLYKDMKNTGKSSAQKELEVELLLWGYTDSMIASIANAPTFSERRKIDIIRILKEVKKIADNRMKDAEVYSSTDLRTLLETSTVSLDSIIASLIGSGISETDARAYIANTLKEVKNYDKNYDSSEVEEYSGSNHKSENKKDKGGKKSDNKSAQENSTEPNSDDGSEPSDSTESGSAESSGGDSGTSSSGE